MFLLHDREDKFRRKAAIVIQCAYRCHLARVAMRDRYRSQYRKMYDADSEQYMYQNKKSLEIDVKLPAYFKKETLPSPRDLEAPIEYNPGNELNSDGCALVITNTVFPLGKWFAQAPPELENDHDHLVDLLSHEFIGRMRPEHVISLKNPSTDEIQKAFKDLRSVSRSYGFAFIYIATHLITINKSDKENKQENAYFAFKNSIWSKNPELIESTISLTKMSQLINKIPCKEKNIFLNYAHHTPPRKVLFPSSKLLYPPPTSLQRLADLCNCPVIGCCSIGSSIREYLKYHPGRQFQRRTARAIGKPEEAAATATPLTDNDSITSIDNVIRENEDEETVKVIKKKKSVYQSSLWRHLLKDFEIPSIPEITKTPKPPKPAPTWKKDGSTDNKVQVQMPTEEERKTYQRRVLYWQFRRGLAKPVNLVKQLNIAYKKYSLTAPQQTSLIQKENSVFGRAVVKALNGGASRPDSNYIDLATVFLYIYDIMKRSVKKLNDKGGKTKKRENEEAVDENGSLNGGGSVTAATHYSQIPVLYIPKNQPKSKLTLFNTSNNVTTTQEDHYEKYLSYRVFYRCSPPPAPERPYINAINDDSVTLEWFNPTFHGIEASKYKIYVKNNTRNYRKWKEIHYAGDITKTVFTVRNLPIGVSCEFKVAAGNAGGWGEMSEETDSVIPGEDKTSVIPKRIIWRRLQQSGIIGILDYLEQLSYSYEDQEHGLKVIIGIIQTTTSDQHGLKSYSLILKLINRLFYNLNQYSNHPMIISYCFIIIGWCLLIPKYERKLRHYCMSTMNLINIINKYDEKYYYHSHIQNSIQFIKQGDILKYFKLQEVKEALENGPPVPKVTVTAKQLLNQKQNEQDQPKERKYLLNYSIPGRHRVMFPRDDSDDDLEDDSDDDEGEVNDEEIEEEIRKMEAMKQKEKKAFKAIIIAPKKKGMKAEPPPPTPPEPPIKNTSNKGKKGSEKLKKKVVVVEDSGDSADDRPVSKSFPRKVSFAPDSKKDRFNK